MTLGVGLVRFLNLSFLEEMVGKLVKLRREQWQKREEEEEEKGSRVKGVFEYGMLL